MGTRPWPRLRVPTPRCKHNVQVRWQGRGSHTHAVPGALVCRHLVLHVGPHQACGVWGVAEVLP